MAGKLVKVHLWSDIPNHKALGFIPKASMGPNAHRHAAPGEIAQKLTSLKSLESVLKDFLAPPSIRVDRLDFHTHGSPGGIALGSERLRYNTLKRFKNMGLDKVFSPTARVFFHGCNVAKGIQGELFLAEFGHIFLKGGGRVGGSTSLGIANPVGGTTAHFWGQSVYANVKSGGKVTLKRHSHLDKKLTQSAIDSVQRHVDKLKNLYGGNGHEGSTVGKGVKKAEMNLKTARAKLAAAGSGQKRFAFLHDAHYYTGKAHQAIQNAEHLVRE